MDAEAGGFRVQSSFPRETAEATWGPARLRATGFVEKLAGWRSDRNSGFSMVFTVFHDVFTLFLKKSCSYDVCIGFCDVFKHE